MSTLAERKCFCTFLRREWQPTPVFLPTESHGQRSLVGTVHRVTKSRTRLSDFHFTSVIMFTCFALDLRMSESQKYYVFHNAMIDQIL